MFNQVIVNTSYAHNLHGNPTTWTPRYRSTMEVIHYLMSKYPRPQDTNTPNNVVSFGQEGWNRFPSLAHEAYLCASLDDGKTNLPKLLAIDYKDNELSVAFSTIPGKTFASIIDQFFTTDEYKLADIINILSKVLDSIRYLYNKYKFTHYRLCPENIIVGQDGKVSITDLGVSHACIDGMPYGADINPFGNNLYLITNSDYWAFDIYRLLMTIKRQISTLYTRVETNRHRDADSRKPLLAKIKQNLPSNALDAFIDRLLCYFIDPKDFDRINSTNPYLCPPRIDLVPEYSKYLTTFDHFYEFYRNTINK